MSKKKEFRIRTDILCNLKDCNFHNSDIGLCIHKRPDLWLWKDEDTVDWKCNSYTFNELFGLSKEELDRYNKTRKRESFLKQISAIKGYLENPNVGKGSIESYKAKLKKLRRDLEL